MKTIATDFVRISTTFVLFGAVYGHLDRRILITSNKLIFVFWKLVFLFKLNSMKCIFFKMFNFWYSIASLKVRWDHFPVFYYIERDEKITFKSLTFFKLLNLELSTFILTPFIAVFELSTFMRRGTPHRKLISRGRRWKRTRRWDADRKNREIYAWRL